MGRGFPSALFSFSEPRSQGRCGRWKKAGPKPRDLSDSNAAIWAVAAFCRRSRRAVRPCVRMVSRFRRRRLRRRRRRLRLPCGVRGPAAPCRRQIRVALGAAVETDRALEIFVAIVVGEFGGEVTGLRHRAAVELPGAVGGAGEGSDYALHVDLHRLFGKAVFQRFGALDQLRTMEIADPIPRSKAS